MAGRRAPVVGLGVIVALVAFHALRTSNPCGPLLRAAACSGPRERRAIALTFDDGPTQPYTREILGILADQRVSATFFVLGASVAQVPDLLTAIVSGGHEVGTHGYWHSSMSWRPAWGIGPELDRVDQLLTQGGAPAARWVRPPFGRMPTLAPFLFLSHRKRAVLWDVEPYPSEFEGGTADTITESVLSRARAGSIILLHDGGGDRSATVQALPRIVSGLRRRGFQMVTLSTLLESP